MSETSSNSSDLGLVREEEEESWEDWKEESNQLTKSLFDNDKLFNSSLDCLNYDKLTFNVDLVLLASTLDFFERIRLINWIRATKPDPKSLARLDRNAAFLQDDIYLKPIIEDDPLLQIDFDSLYISAPSTSTATTSTNSPYSPTQEDLISALRVQLSDSNQALEQLKTIYKERLGESLGLGGGEEEEKIPVVDQSKKNDSGEKGKGSEERDDDSHYFESYAYNEIHEIMLKDKIRTNAYRDFILANPSIFKDAVVLDVGCGTGILSMFAAQSGAKKVYAVDASAVAFKAERNIRDNGLDGIITVFKGKIEDIEIPEKVDVIVSEWMGYFLLYECMLDSVLSARDRFMKPTGLMVPSQCSIMLSLLDGGNLIKDRVEFWNDVYGYKMESMKEEIYDEALIDIVSKDDVVSDEVALKDVLTQTCTIPSLTFSVPFTLVSTKATKVNAFLGHFDTFFTTDGRLAEATLGSKALNNQGGLKHGSGMGYGGEVFFTTGPAGVSTHWKQTLFLIRGGIEVREGSIVSGQFTCSKNPENSRELIVEVTWEVKHLSGEKVDLKAQVWKVR